MKKKMSSVKGGEFYDWYNTLTDKEKKLYHETFKELQKKERR